MNLTIALDDQLLRKARAVAARRGVSLQALIRAAPVAGCTVLLTEEDGLFNPASIAFGTAGDDRQYVFLSNFALLPPEPANSLGPGVLKYYVGSTGLPLP